LKIFPNADCYIVTYKPGSGGHLISTLLYYLLFDSDDVVADVSELGHAHTNQQTLIMNTWNKESQKHIPADSATTRSFNLYTVIEPQNNTVIFQEHPLIKNYKHLKQRFPKFKQLFIVTEKHNLGQIGLNVFLKVIVDLANVDLANLSISEPDEKGKSFNAVCKWNNIQKEFLRKRPKEVWIQEYHNPTNMLDNKKHFKIFCEVIFPKDKIFTGINHQWNIKNIKASVRDYQKHVHYITFDDIIHNSDSVLNTLSSVTNKPVTKAANNYYKNWLSKQKLLEDIRNY